MNNENVMKKERTRYDDFEVERDEAGFPCRWKRLATFERDLIR
jgi:hypothetical protein